MYSAKQILSVSKSIAVVRTDKLGDMVLTLPLINAIKKRYPDVQLSIIANSYTKTILDNLDLDVHTFYVDEFKDGINQVFSMSKFDAVFFPRPRPDEAYAAFKAGIRMRVGSGYRLYSLLFTHRIWEHRKKGDKHEAEYNVRLLSEFLNKESEVELPRVNIPERAKRSLSAKLNEIGISDNYIILHPGTGGSSNDWDAKNFGLLAKEIKKNYDVDILITGVKAEQEKCEIALEHSSGAATNICSLLKLEEMFALLSRARLIVVNSTGVLHLSSLFDTPIVGLYPNTSHISQRRWGPLSSSSIVINPPNVNDKNKDDMSLIDIDSVYTAVDRMLSNK